MLLVRMYPSPFSFRIHASHTDRKILDMLPGRPPQVTFSCDKADATCDFQFWTAQIESFYCALDTCQTEVILGYDSNTTSYQCEKIKCSCVPGRFICGEDGSVGKHIVRRSMFYA
jgi:hypothetical protein